MRLEGSGKLLRIFVGERDRWQGGPLHLAIVERLRAAGIAGATVFKGIEGYGMHGVVHASRILDVGVDLPILIEAVDTEEAIRGVLPAIEEMVTEGMVTLESVEVIRYRPRQRPG